jgi:hypothetical protein
MTGGWIGVDLDGTFAHDLPGRHDPTIIGPPVVPMLRRIKKWLADGEDVRIFTARVFCPPGNRKRAMEAALSRQAIIRYCQKHLGRVLPITCQKDYNMRVLYDDRAVQVRKNDGRLVGCSRCSM